MNDDWSSPAPRIRSSWNTTHLLLRGPLTDKKIDRYSQEGWYSSAFREARREMWQRRQARREAKRSGNFLIVDGRMVYSPQ